MKKQFNKKSQSSLEFIVLITFMLVIFTVVAIMVQRRMIDVQDIKTRETVLQIKDIVFTEIEIAEAMPVNYSRNFSLPVYLDGSDYEVKFKDGVELIIDFRGKEYVYFAPRDLNPSSYLVKGSNVFTKKLYSTQYIYSFNAPYYP